MASKESCSLTPPSSLRRSRVRLGVASQIELHNNTFDSLYARTRSLCSKIAQTACAELIHMEGDGSIGFNGPANKAYLDFLSLRC